MHRIQPLLAGVDLKDPGQLFGNLMKQDRVQLLVGDLLAYVPQGLGTHILGSIPFLGNIEGVVPLLMEGQLIDRLVIR